MNPFDFVNSQVRVINRAMARGMQLERDVQKNRKRQTFDDFLQDRHAEDYHGTDDNMPDAYEHWCSELDVQEVCDYAQLWGDTLV